MPGHIFDLDGTLIEHHRGRRGFHHKWLPGAKEMLKRLLKRGDSVLIVTARNPSDDDKTASMKNAKEFLESEGFGHIPIVFGVKSNRTIYDDYPPKAKHHVSDSPW